MVSWPSPVLMNIDHRASRCGQDPGGVGGGGPTVGDQAGSVPPAEQHRLITAERHAEQACAEVMAPRTEQPG
jgi:hypothetical protein